MVGPPKIVPPKMSIARTFLLVASPTVQWRQGQEVTNVAFRDVSADRSVGKPWKWGRTMWKKIDAQPAVRPMKNRRSQNEHGLPTNHFQVRAVSFGEFGLRTGRIFQILDETRWMSNIAQGLGLDGSGHI